MIERIKRASEIPIRWGTMSAPRTLRPSGVWFALIGSKLTVLPVFYGHFFYAFDRASSAILLLMVIAVT